MWMIKNTVVNICIQRKKKKKRLKKESTTYLILTMWTLPSLTGINALIRFTSSSSLQQKAYWNILENPSTWTLTSWTFDGGTKILAINDGGQLFCFYLQDSIQDEEFHEEKVTIRRSLVHIENCSVGCLSLKPHSNDVEQAEFNTFKLQIWIPKVLNVAWIYEIREYI